MAENRKPGRGRGADHDERRAQIVRAAVSVVAAHGTDQLSIRNVAKQAGVSIGRVQHYFPSKDGLLEAAFRHVSEHSGRRVRNRVARMGTGALPAVVLLEILGELLPRGATDVKNFRITQAFDAFALTRPELHTLVQQRHAELIEALANTLENATGQRDDEGAGELVAMSLGLSALAATDTLSAREAERIALRQLDAVLARAATTTA